MDDVDRTNHRAPTRHPRPAQRPVVGAAGLALVIMAIAGCGASSSTSPNGQSSTVHTTRQPNGQSSTPGGSTQSAASSPQVEINPPGDIPDNQAYVRYTGAGYTVSVPEGWSRTMRSGAVIFTDKYNSITITTTAVSHRLTPATVRSTELPAIRAAASGYSPGRITSVRRTAGPAVLITYQAFSPVNPVTNKVAKEAVERYEFWRNGREVALTLAAPVGSDNVDPWRKVTDSFSWSGK